MKETQIAKENVRGCGHVLKIIPKIPVHFCKGIKRDNIDWSLCDKCQTKSKEHKASCERFLEFLLAMQKWRSWERMSAFAQENISNKIIDLQNAIKTYEDVGIK